MRMLLMASLLLAQARPFVTSAAAASPSVVATLIARSSSPPTSVELQLLVLWRGSPGWFNRESPGPQWTNSWGVNPVNVEIHLGTPDLTLTFDTTTHEVWIHGVRIAVPPDANVILLDDVDVGFVAGIPGPKVVGTLHIEPYLDVGPNRRLVPQDFIRRSPELISYLRCNTGELPQLKDLCIA